MADYVYLDDEPIEKKPKERKRISMKLWRKSLSALLAVCLAFVFSASAAPKPGMYVDGEPTDGFMGYTVYWGGGGGEDTGF